MKKLYFDSISSTNSKLKEILCTEILDEFSIVQAGFQTAGRGQKGNFWESKAGENLTFSVLLQPFFVPIEKQFILSQIVSLALKDTLDLYIKDVSIKWPNDIYYRDSKICGILIENILSEDGISTCIVGIGLNINQTIFESDAPNPISMAGILKRKLDIDVVLNTFMQKLTHIYTDAKNINNWDVIRQQYFNSLYRGKGEYEFEDSFGYFFAEIITVDDEGFMYLRKTESGQINKYAFKEVKYIL